MVGEGITTIAPVSGKQLFELLKALPCDLVSSLNVRFAYEGVDEARISYGKKSDYAIRAFNGGIIPFTRSLFDFSGRVVTSVTDETCFDESKLINALACGHKTRNIDFEISASGSGRVRTFSEFHVLTLFLDLYIPLRGVIELGGADCSLGDGYRFPKTYIDFHFPESLRLVPGRGIVPSVEQRLSGLLDIVKSH